MNVTSEKNYSEFLLLKVIFTCFLLKRNRMSYYPTYLPLSPSQPCPSPSRFYEEITRFSLERYTQSIEQSIDADNHKNKTLSLPTCPHHCHLTTRICKNSFPDESTAKLKSASKSLIQGYRWSERVEQMPSNRVSNAARHLINRRYALHDHISAMRSKTNREQPAATIRIPTGLTDSISTAANGTDSKRLSVSVLHEKPHHTTTVKQQPNINTRKLRLTLPTCMPYSIGDRV